MATYPYITTRAQDAILTRALARINGDRGAQGLPTFATVADLIAFKITEALDTLAAEQTSVELTRVANAFAQTSLAGRDRIIAAAEAARALPGP